MGSVEGGRAHLGLTCSWNWIVLFSVFIVKSHCLQKSWKVQACTLSVSFYSCDSHFDQEWKSNLNNYVTRILKCMYFELPICNNVISCILFYHYNYWVSTELEIDFEAHVKGKICSGLVLNRVNMLLTGILYHSFLQTNCTDLYSTKCIQVMYMYTPFMIHLVISSFSGKLDKSMHTFHRIFFLQLLYVYILVTVIVTRVVHVSVL